MGGLYRRPGSHRPDGARSSARTVSGQVSPARDPPPTGQGFVTAAPGRMLAITGPSGAGKSTVARLLRFRDPDAGRILLDGIDVRELSLRTLRYNVTLLTQEAPEPPGRRSAA